MALLSRAARRRQSLARGASDADRRLARIGGSDDPCARSRPNPSPPTPDAVAPDGTAVRLLPRSRGGSFAHFELPAGAVSHAVAHRTVEEIWYFVAGAGELWRRLGRDRERRRCPARASALTIPLGNAVPVPRRRRGAARLRRRHHAALAGRGRGLRRRRPVARHRPLIYVLRSRGVALVATTTGAGLAQLVEQLICNQ